MSQQGPVIVVSATGRPSFAAALDETRVFPIIDAGWNDASRAVETLQPAAVLAAMPAAGEPRLDALAKQIAARQPYLPLIAVDAKTPLPENAIPFSLAVGSRARARRDGAADRPRRGLSRAVGRVRRAARRGRRAQHRGRCKAPQRP